MALPHRSLRVLAYAAIYVLWGGSFLAIRDMVATTPPFFAAGVRFLLAGAVLYGIARGRGTPFPTRKEWWHSLGMGLAMFTVSYAGLFWAEVRIASGAAAVLMAMISIWILLGESVVLRTQPLSRPALAGAMLGIVGVALVSRSVGLHREMLAGAAALIASGLIFAAATLWSRSLTLPANQLMRAGLQMALGGAGQLILSGAAGEYQRLPAAIRAWHWHTTVSFLYLVLCASIIAFTAYTWLIHHEPATRVGSYAYVNPLIALMIGVALGGERIAWLQALGTAMIIVGVVVTLRGRRAGRAAPELQKTSTSH